MDFLIKYVAYTSAKREVVIPHCPNADVALQAFKKFIELNRVRFNKITEILTIPKTKGPKHGTKNSSHPQTDENRKRSD